MKNPFKKTFSYSKQYIDKDDIKGVIKVLKSDMLTQGPKILETEKKISNYLGCKYSVLVSSCSAGLHIACKAIGLNKKSRVITSPITFVSTATAAVHCGAKIFLADINNSTLNICEKDLEKKIKKDKKIDLIMPVHFSGTPCNMGKIKKLANSIGAHIIEDAAHAFGSKYSTGEKVGCCKFSDIAVFSFHPVKTIACGEGGVITTNSKKIYLKLLELRSHGIIKNKNERFYNKTEGYTDKKKNIWFYEMKDLGFNYRLTDIQSSLIGTQLKKIKTFLNYRRILAKRYDKFFDETSNISVYNKNFRDLSSNHLYIININFNSLKISRNHFMSKLRNYGIITQVHYIPLNFHPYFIKKKLKMPSNSNSNIYYKNCLSIPLFYKLNFKEQDFIIKKIKNLIKRFSR